MAPIQTVLSKTGTVVKWIRIWGQINYVTKDIVFRCFVFHDGKAFSVKYFFQATKGNFSLHSNYNIFFCFCSMYLCMYVCTYICIYTNKLNLCCTPYVLLDGKTQKVVSKASPRNQTSYPSKKEGARELKKRIRPLCNWCFTLSAAASSLLAASSDSKKEAERYCRPKRTIAVWRARLVQLAHLTILKAFLGLKTGKKNVGIWKK